MCFGPSMEVIKGSFVAVLGVDHGWLLYLFGIHGTSKFDNRFQRLFFRDLHATRRKTM